MAMKKVKVKGHRREDGTKVKGHTRKVHARKRRHHEEEGMSESRRKRIGRRLKKNLKRLVRETRRKG